MDDIRSILLLLFLLPAVTLAQTIHKEKDKILYKGKFKPQAVSDSREQLKTFLYEHADPDSIKEEKDTKTLSSIVVVELPSSHHLQQFLRYKVKLEPSPDGIHYEIDGVQLKLHERGEKEKILSSADLLKGMDESGNASRDAEKILNEIDMYIQQYIARMQLSFSNNE